MKTYEHFHGETQIQDIGQELRKIVRQEKTAFKILTGYGSTSGKSDSKFAALKALSRMEREGLIKGFVPGEVKRSLLSDTDPYYKAKQNYISILKADSDYGNDGIIFVFIT